MVAPRDATPEPQLSLTTLLLFLLYPHPRNPLRHSRSGNYLQDTGTTSEGSIVKVRAFTTEHVVG